MVGTAADPPPAVASGRGASGDEGASSRSASTQDHPLAIKPAHSTFDTAPETKLPSRASGAAAVPHATDRGDIEAQVGGGIAAVHSRTSSQSKSSSSDHKAAALADDADKKETAGGYRYNPGDRTFVHVKKRDRFYQFWRPKELPPPPPLSLDDAKLIPLENANILSVLTYQWAQPIMVLGYQRALEATDLYKLGESKSSRVMSERFLKLWDERVAAAKTYNEKLQDGTIPVGVARRVRWTLAYAALIGTGRGRRAVAPARREKLWRAPPPAEMDQGHPNYSGHRQAQIYACIIHMFWRTILIAIACKITGDVAQITSPLLIHVIINYGSVKYAHAKGLPTDAPDQSNGVGIGYAIALFVLQVIGSVFQHQYFFRSMSMGVYARSTLISAIFERSLSLGGKDRSAGKLLNHASTDCSRIDFASQWGSLALTSPIALGLCLGLLIAQIGPSALVGFALLVIAIPFQGMLMKAMFRTRKTSMMWTDKRSKLINELLTSIRVVKSFAQESKFLDRLGFIRRKEMMGIRKLLIFRSVNNAVAFSLPTLAAVVSFVLYYNVKGSLNVADIFTALTLFQLLRLPLMFLPLSFSAMTDGYNASLRINSVFLADQLKDLSEHSNEAKSALSVADASFVYDEVKRESDVPQSKKKMAAAAKAAKTAQPHLSSAEMMRAALKKVRGGNRSNVATPRKGSAVPTPTASGTATPNRDAASAPRQAKALTTTERLGDRSEAVATEEQVGPQLGDGAALEEKPAASGDDDGKAASHDEPFGLHHLNLQIERGELVGIVGPVGSGKSTLFESLLGEVRQTGGTIVWGGSGTVAYCPQQPWIQAASVRENILFGQPYDEDRYWEVVNVTELESDLAILPQGDQTEIGERGTTLSGGQKARVNLARALYYNADTYALDDPLSAVDPHVAKALFQNAILGLKARGKTVLLVTHAIHVLPQVDRVITMLDGEIVESGTYHELEHANGAFSKLVEEFGGQDQEDEEEEDEQAGIENADSGDKKKPLAKKFARNQLTVTVEEKEMLSQEERNTGSMGSGVYRGYMKAGNGAMLIPALLASVALMQAATVLNSYWLVWWESDRFHKTPAFYMGVYAALGIAQAIATFLMGAVSGIFTYYAAVNLHEGAIRRMLHAPLSTFFDVQPKGRIMNRMTKDMDTLDNLLPDSARMAISTIGTVIGAIILITVLTHYFIVAVAAVVVIYGMASVMYRRGSREIKRLDALLRSSLYAHFSETLTGLATVRAYQETPRFRREHHKHLDIENRAYYFSICNQRFLGVRLDIIGAILVFVVAILTTVGANTINPGEVGLALSFMLTVSQAFSWATRQIAEVENDMNSAERIEHYANNLEQEAPQEVPEANLDPAWPTKGAIDFDNVTLRYRPGLPIVLKGITLSLKGGEKTAIVGRTGAGKSSLLTCLLRLIELEKGSIRIDGVDIAKIGLSDLRSRVGYLPQEPVLFSGTIRSNLDPFGIYDEQRLNDALKRSYLISSEDSNVVAGTTNPTAGQNSSHVHLDTPLNEEGANLSLGQRSLVSLARALVKDSQIILLDEATASVDVQTDALIQTTIRNEFAHKTLLTIAHRLRTIIGYDKVAVFEKGEVEEFGSPLALFDANHIFRNMCDKASIVREDIVRAAQQQEQAVDKSG